MGLPEDLMPIVSCLRDLRSLVKGVGGKKLNSNYSELIDKYVASYSYLHQVFGVSKTPKFQVIEAHLKYYIDTTKKSLGFYSDSLIESMHQYLDKLMCKSNYHVKDVESEIHGIKLLKASKHVQFRVNMLHMSAHTYFLCLTPIPRELNLGSDELGPRVAMCIMH